MQMCCFFTRNRTDIASVDESNSAASSCPDAITNYAAISCADAIPHDCGSADSTTHNVIYQRWIRRLQHL